MLDRRKFLQRMGMLTGAATFTIGGVPMRSFGHPLFDDDGADNQRILVFLQLAGGNDGLNTLVPFEDSIYYNNRPTLSLPKNDLHKVNSLQGFHPQMKEFAGLYDRGKMSIIQNVGYENPDRSHFKAMDIWNSAIDPEKVQENGWAARYLTNSLDGKNSDRKYPMAIELGWSGSLLLEDHNVAHGLFMNSLGEYLNITQQFSSPAMSNNISLADVEFDYINYVAKQSNRYARRISNASMVGKNVQEYPNTFLGKQLAIVAKLISGGLETNIYMVKLKGFDTHFLQAEPHANLLKEMSDAVSVFQKDIEDLGVSEKVTMLVYSEFGRRLKEGSYGTDHGTAAPTFVLGDTVRPGIIGNNPNLSSLDSNGDLQYKFDFRQIYSTIMQDHLQISDGDIQTVLGKEYQTLPIFKSSIEALPSEKYTLGSIYPNPAVNEITADFSLSERGYTALDVYSLRGQHIFSNLNRVFLSGNYSVPVDCSRLAPGHYIMALSVDGKRSAKAFIKI